MVEYFWLWSEVPLNKSFNNKGHKKISVPRTKKDKFLFFGSKMIQRQNVPATKRPGTKSSCHQNADTEKLRVNITKSSSPDNKKKPL